MKFFEPTGFSSQKGHFKGMPFFNHVIKNYVIHGGNSEGLGAAEDLTSKGKLRGQLVTRFSGFKFVFDTFYLYIMHLC